ncbi:hypothetical protein TOT_010000557 [Theileria orientalis strain Shintoku]|uniref:Uncharacterized protein n=1 Tax=Theileria orientalis strain Shintoku TaxID=869250 RepID=J4D5P2_THEOR|nr:hypothetical protein TOT_010000557 [Theileria orientalis strain Shintoku]BAM39095.1 hypothetical protein TOT_010000557 [Theileria orientalis strain Shintoku]|eukprot:XP_009689396.1 hypothetical protein TOT_010000557 [Theileria orientalis strain Shintoku]
MEKLKSEVVSEVEVEGLEKLKEAPKKYILKLKILKEKIEQAVVDMEVDKLKNFENEVDVLKESEKSRRLKEVEIEELEEDLESEKQTNELKGESASSDRGKEVDNSDLSSVWLSRVARANGPARSISRVVGLVRAAGQASPLLDEVKRIVQQTQWPRVQFNSNFLNSPYKLAQIDLLTRIHGISSRDCHSLANLFMYSGPLDKLVNEAGSSSD